MNDPAFQIVTLADGRGLRLIGELDMATVPELRTALALLPEGSLTLDLAELSFIDSTGLHAIVKYADGLNGSGPLVLENAPARIRRVFEITHLDSHPAIDLRGPGGGS
jgi:anti-anti-sigma factor